jgi:hypothetical protein
MKVGNRSNQKAGLKLILTIHTNIWKSCTAYSITLLFAPIKCSIVKECAISILTIGAIIVIDP